MFIAIYVRDNVYNTGHYREIIPDRENRTPMRTGGVLLRPEGDYFPIMPGDVLYIILLITRLLVKTEKMTSNNIVTIYLLPAFIVLISRIIVHQSRLATEDAGVDKLHRG